MLCVPGLPRSRTWKDARLDIAYLDMFSRRKGTDPRNPAAAASYRDLVLKLASQEPAASLIHDFLGRDPKTAALEEELSSR
jgi:Zn-dependent oligopeptidase